MSGITEKIISFADRRFIMWAEPDEGSYNYKLFDLGSRYERDIEVPKEIEKYIVEHASKYYPIIIVDGYHLDSILDMPMCKESSHITAFGQHPRIIVNPPYSDSISSFVQRTKKGKRSL